MTKKTDKKETEVVPELTPEQVQQVQTNEAIVATINHLFNTSPDRTLVIDVAGMKIKLSAEVVAIPEIKI